jgi:hypothetical protein
MSPRLPSASQLLVEYFEKNYKPEPFTDALGFYHFVYLTYNKKNFKFYIGKHSTRKLSDGYLGSGHRIQSEINLYGKEWFSTMYLAFFDNEKACLRKEKELISSVFLEEYAPYCYNRDIGGQQTVLGTKSMIDMKGRERKISASEVNEYLEKGWLLGARKKHRNKAIIKLNEVDKKWWIRNSYDDLVESVWVNDSKLISTRIKPNVLPDFLDAGWVEGMNRDLFFVPQEVLRTAEHIRNFPEIYPIVIASYEYLKNNQLMRTFLFESDLRESFKNCVLPPDLNGYKELFLEPKSVKQWFRTWYIGEIKTQLNPKTNLNETCLYLIIPTWLAWRNTLDIPPTRVKKLQALMDEGDFSVEEEYENAILEEYEDDCCRRDADWIE